MSSPVTVSVTRHVDPGREAEMLSWLEAGATLAQRFPGFLGAGWVRPEPESETWHMLYRFADPAALMTWEQSPQREWWRSSAVGLGVVESRSERRTGIEGWFDEPAVRDVRDLRAEASAPPPAPPARWRQMVVIFLVFYPLSVVVNAVAGPLVGDVVLPLRVLLVVLVMTPVMTYVALPWMTRRMEWFLQGSSKQP